MEPARHLPPAAAVPAPAGVPAGGGLAAQRAAALAGGSSMGPDLTAPLKEDVERRLKARYAPTYLDVEDQGGNCDAAKIAIVMVSASFRGQSKLNRQRDVQAMCKPYLDFGTMHALSLSLRSPEEYEVILKKQGS
mmetsp:Transcript_93918/g.245045  ORF Transcript_93918/g.245045 Transcript_93918/m.245045 type:complete len:135 (-) Transcript_93918:116-520(-)